jgi:hypothetical protein
VVVVVVVVAAAAAVMVVMVVVGVRTYVAEACWADVWTYTAIFIMSPHTAAATEHPEVRRLSMRYFKLQVFKDRLKFA